MAANHPLRNWREKNRRTLEEFGQLIGKDKSTVCSYELGRRRPRYETLARIIVATEGEITAKDFMGREAAE